MCFGRAIAPTVSLNDNRPGSFTRAMCLSSLVLFGLEPEVDLGGRRPNRPDRVKALRLALSDQRRRKA
jgi:hypothetical protein